MLYVILALVGGILLGIGIFYFVNKGKGNSNEELSETIEEKLSELVPKALMEANEYLVKTARESLSSETKQNRLDLDNKREEIGRLIKGLEEYVKVSEKDRIDSFSSLKTSLEESRRVTEQLSVNTESLKKVLSNNQLRGQFGEQVADDLLKMAGFVVGETYTRQESENGSRPDFTVYLPDRTKINVDAKFPYSSLQRMTETDDTDAKNRYMRQFETDI